MKRFRFDVWIVGSDNFNKCADLYFRFNCKHAYSHIQLFIIYVRVCKYIKSKVNCATMTFVSWFGTKKKKKKAIHSFKLYIIFSVNGYYTVVKTNSITINNYKSRQFNVNYLLIVFWYGHIVFDYFPLQKRRNIGASWAYWVNRMDLVDEIERVTCWKKNGNVDGFQPFHA